MWFGSNKSKPEQNLTNISINLYSLISSIHHRLPCIGSSDIDKLHTWLNQMLSRSYMILDTLPIWSNRFPL